MICNRFDIFVELYFFLDIFLELILDEYFLLLGLEMDFGEGYFELVFFLVIGCNFLMVVENYGVFFFV